MSALRQVRFWLKILCVNTPKPTLLFLLAVATLFSLAGCGDSPDVQTKSNFRQEAIAICEEGEQARIEAIAALDRHLPKRQRDQEERAILAALPPYETTVRELAELDAPPGETAKISAIIAAMNQGARTAHRKPLLVYARKPPPFQQANRMLGDYGLAQCELLGEPA